MPEIDYEAEVQRLEAELADAKARVTTTRRDLNAAQAHRKAQRQKTCTHPTTKCIELKGVGTIGGCPAFADQCAHCEAIVKKRPVQHDMTPWYQRYGSDMESW